MHKKVLKTCLINVYVFKYYLKRKRTSKD